MRCIHPRKKDLAVGICGENVGLGTTECSNKLFAGRASHTRRSWPRRVPKSFFCGSVDVPWTSQQAATVIFSDNIKQLLHPVPIIFC